MTVSSTVAKSVRNGNGVTTSFDFDFRILSEDDLEVWLVDEDGVETLVDPEDYTVVDGDPDGSITYPLSGDPVATGYTLIILRKPSLLQTTAWTNGGAFSATTLNRVVDRIYMVLQYLRGELDRAILMPLAESGFSLTATAEDRAGLLLGFDTDGNLGVVTGDAVADAVLDEAADAVIDAENAADQAAASATASAASATAAASSATTAATNAAVISNLRIFNVVLPPYNADPTGTAYCDVAITAAVNAAIAAGGGEVYLPRGAYRMQSANFLVATMTSAIFSGLTVRGAGRGATYILTDFTSGSGVIIGNSAVSAGTKPTTRVLIEGISFLSSVTHTSGALFRIENASKVVIRDFDAAGYFSLATIGSSGTADDVLNSAIRGEWQYDAPSTHGDAIVVNSAALLRILDGKINGVGSGTAAAIRLGAGQNVDGLMVERNTMEQWPYALRIDGAGASNLGFMNNTTDRAEQYAVYLAPTSLVFDAQFIGNRFMSSSALGGAGLIASTGAGGQVEGLVVQGNSFINFDGRALNIGGTTGAIITGNRIKGCGASGTPSVEIGANSDIIFSDNRVNPHASATYALSYQGTGRTGYGAPNHLSAAASGTTFGTF